MLPPCTHLGDVAGPGFGVVRGPVEAKASSFGCVLGQKLPAYAASIPAGPFLCGVARPWQQHALGGGAQQLGFCTGFERRFPGQVCAILAPRVVPLPRRGLCK